jgi:16S rRNA (cytidine1402-2'-O)-methyltransferase
MLTICPTPIGNLGDVTPRQRTALEQADIIASEDTRTTAKLLDLLGLGGPNNRPRLRSYHDHNAADVVDSLIAAMLRGEHVVLVCEAGTPTIADPGYRLVKACREAKLDVVSLPGPAAAIVALSASGLPTDRFFFEGFLPAKSGARQRRLSAIAERPETTIFYVAPHRLIAVMTDVAAAFGIERRAFVGRELTKVYEEHVVGTLREITATLSDREKIRGECVLIVEGKEESSRQIADDEVDDWIVALLDEGVPTPAIKRAVAKVTGLDKKEVFARIVSHKKDDSAEG